MTTPDNNFMRAAAEKAIRDLQQQADNAQRAATTAKAAADSAASLASRWRKVTVAGLTVLVLLFGLGTWSFFSFRQATVHSCQVGNDRAQGTVVVIDELVKLLEGPHPTAKTIKEAADYEAYVAAHNQQRDCSRVYSIIP